MKMISNTNTTSTSGVTLMSGGIAPRLRRAPLTPGLRAALRPVLGRVEELSGRAIQRRFVARDRVGQVVEGENGGDRDREAERGFDQRFADPGGHRRKTAGAGRGDPLKRR